MEHRILELRSVGSTNTYAEELLSSGSVQEGTVILAEEQTSGKGLENRIWESEAGKNLTFSIVLFPKFLPPGNQFLLNKAITLGVLDFFHTLDLKPPMRVKWPNDIYAGDRKIGGILIRNTVIGDRFDSCVAGIGINLNQTRFSPDLPNPVSLILLTGIESSPSEMLLRLLEKMDLRYNQLMNGEISVLDLDYRENLFALGIWREYGVNRSVLTGRILDVDESGRLILEQKDGRIMTLNHGEIGFFPEREM